MFVHLDSRHRDRRMRQSADTSSSTRLSSGARIRTVGDLGAGRRGVWWNETTNEAFAAGGRERI
jgi:hypothetical protein